MRDILVTLIVFGFVPLILMRPWVGVLAWSWVSYMNPHLLAWGFARSMPFAQIVALTLIVSLLINKDKKGIPINTTTAIWIAFIVWMGITTALAIYPDAAMNYYERVLKIQIVTFFTFMLITDVRRVNYLIATIVISIGYFSVKGGIFTITTGGGFIVYGPGGMIGENNAFALATLMVIPMMYYLRFIATNIWVKRLLLAAILLSLASALGSQSRGALLTMAAAGVYFWWQSKSKAASGALIAMVMVVGFFLMPQSWHDRMASIATFSEDESSMARIQAWEYSVNLANDRFTGGGFNSWSKENYNKYRPGALGAFVAHSIYFNVLADHGWIGLFMFLSILFLTWRTLTKSVSRAKEKGRDDLAVLAAMLKLSMVAYMSGGVFLSLSYFDLPWHVIAIAVILKMIIEKSEESKDSHDKPIAAIESQEGHSALMPASHYLGRRK